MLFQLSHLRTARIAESMGKLLRAGLPAERLFDVLMRHRSRRERDALDEVRKSVLNGHTFREGFAARPRFWPRYFIELVRCSERAGMLYAGFEEGADHFRKMARTHRAAQMLWAGPVILILFGWLLRFLLRLIFVDFHAAFVFAGDRAFLAARVVVPAALALYIPPLRRMLDQAAIHLPIIGETVRDLSFYQFTECFRCLYRGAVSAPEILRLAGGAVGNSHLRHAIMSTSTEIERDGVFFADVLEGKAPWPGQYLERMREAEISGQLDVICEVLARERREALEMRAEIVRNVVERCVGVAVGMTLAYEIYRFGPEIYAILFGKK